MAEAATWGVEVIEGPNRGASLQLPAGTYTIGSGEGSDIVLAEGDLGDVAAVLTISETGVELQSDRRAGARLKVVARNRREFRVGQSRIRLSLPQPLRSPVRRRRLPLAIGIGLLFVVPSPFVGESPAASRDVAFVVPASIAVAMQDSAKAPVVAGPSEGSTELDDGSGALIGRLQSNPDLAALEITTVAGGVVAKGYVTHAQAASWIDAKQWFDGTYGSRLALVDETTDAEDLAQPHLAISAVRSGDVRYVLMEGGEKLGEGAVIEDGWTIVAIHRDRVVLRRSGKTVDVML